MTVEANTTIPRKKILKRIKPKFIVIGILILAVIAGVGYFIVKGNPFSKAAAVTHRTARVAKGNLNVTVTGSGAIESSNRVELSPKVTGTITKMYFKEGDTVKAGALMYEIDDSDAKLNVEKVKNNIQQTQLTVSSNQKSMNSLVLKAPFTGRVTNILPKLGDSISKNANILTITDMTKLKLSLPFSGADIKAIRTGQKATVNIQELMQSVSGDVTYVSDSSYSTNTGGEVYDVDITLDNPGTLKEGMKASAEISTNGTIRSSTGTGQMEYINNQTIKCDSGGTVTSIKVKDNQTVKAGDVLVEFRNDDLEVSSQTTDLKMQDLQAQLTAAEKQLADYKVYAPIGGVIVKQEVNVGDSAKPAQALATITDTGHMEFSISIDELDISKIKVGQKVNVTIDALPQTSTKPLTGEVMQVAIEGTSTNGVTTYPVKIKVNDTADLKVGMNANAEIMINEKTDVLLVPLEAVQKMGNRAFVMVKSSGSGQNSQGAAGQNGGAGNMPNGQSSGTTGRGNRNGGTNTQRGAFQGNSANAQYYANTVRKSVELGINNDSYVEVLSGLQEGETVILPPLATSTTQNTTQTAGFGGFGGFGGLGGNQQRQAPQGVQGQQGSNTRRN